MPISDARKRANRKYNEKAYDRIELRVKKGEKAGVLKHAADMGESLNQFLLRAVNNQIEADLKSREPSAETAESEKEDPRSI